MHYYQPPTSLSFKVKGWLAVFFKNMGWLFVSCLANHKDLSKP